MEQTRPRVWLVRAGGDGEDEDAALSLGLALVGWREVPSFAPAETYAEVLAAVQRTYPAYSTKRAQNWAGQLWAFRAGLAEGDIVVMPLKTRRGQVALGRVSGAYEFRRIAGSDRHTRPVKWIRPDVARSAFELDLLRSFGAFLTVCEIKRNDSARRVQGVLEGKPDSGPPSSGAERTEPEGGPAVETAPAGPINIEQAASDEIVAHIRARFPRHEFARLIEAVLQAEGFQTDRSPPGPDGGVDILAGRGSLGLDPASLCVQVKAQEDAADVKVVRELQGTMESYRAQQGLFVCWGGFTRPAKEWARPLTFKIRLWDESDLVDAVYRTYDRLSPEIHAELPLKRVWTLVREDVPDED